MPTSTYWIVVSDDGPSTHPKQHNTYLSAKTEAERLSRLYPNIQFGVCQYSGHARTTPSSKTVTRYVNLYLEGARVRTSEGEGGQYTTEAEAKKVMDGYRGPWKYLKTVPVNLVIDEPKTTFESYYPF